MPFGNPRRLGKVLLPQDSTPEAVMDRCASALPSAPVPDTPAGADAVPAHPLPAVLRVGAVGLILIGVAVLLGLVATAADTSVNSPIHSARVLLVFVGAVTV